MSLLIDIVSSVSLVAAGFFAFIAGLGLLRFGDLPSRMHAATKASGAAFLFALLAVSLRLPQPEIIAKSAIALGFAFLTLPVAAHLLGRGAVIGGKSRGTGRQAEDSEEE